MSKKNSRIKHALRGVTQRHRGFTLIELLVVVAIIAILAAILFPVFATARERGRQAACLAHIRQLALSMSMYMGDSDSKFPILAPGAVSDADQMARLTPEQLANPNVAGRPAYGICSINQGNPMCNDSWFWRGLQPYIKSTQFKDGCPSKHSTADSQGGEPDSWWSSTGYGYNIHLDNDPVPNNPNTGIYEGKNEAALSTPSQTMAFMDAPYPGISQSWGPASGSTPVNYASAAIPNIATYGVGGTGYDTCTGYHGGHGRHGVKMCNICYVDGHVKQYVGKADIVLTTTACRGGVTANLSTLKSDVWVTNHDIFWGIK